jgi:hypothetical protein
LANKPVVDNKGSVSGMRNCPNCGQETGGDYCRWCGYPVIQDEPDKGAPSLEDDDSALGIALRRAAEKRETEEKAWREAEEKAKREAEEKMRRVDEEAARRKAEERARREAEEKARREAQERARREAEEKARHEAEEKARLEAEERARREARERAKREAEETARREAEERARKKAEEKARREAEERAKREARERAKREAEEAKRQRAEQMKAAKDSEREARERSRRWAEEIERNRKQAELEAEERVEEGVEARRQESTEAPVSAGSAGPVTVPVAEKKETQSKVVSGTGGGELYQGEVKLVLVPPIKPLQMRKFQMSLAGIDGLNMGLVGGSDDGGAQITVSVKSPIPLLDILRAIPSVDEALPESKHIKITLQAD